MNINSRINNSACRSRELIPIRFYWVTLVILVSALLSACNQVPIAVESSSSDSPQTAARAFDITELSLPLVQTKNYEEPDSPKFEGRYAPELPTDPDSLTVVTYNIKGGEEVAKAVENFQTLEQLQSADIIMLQEMDETGVEQLAKELGYNYVYYPASVSREGRNTGNAILSRWPMSDTRKVILPNRHPANGQMRIAVRATIHAGASDVELYSTHTETFTTPPSYREAQINAIVEEIGAGDSLTIVGGDFNTASEGSMQSMADQFAAVGMERMAADTGSTISKLGIKLPPFDHILARGFSEITSGTVGEADASDHFPVWVQLELQDNEE